MDPADVSMRVVADHMRAMTFLIADGVVPSNEWRGYVLRKIMRRAMRHGRRLGLEQAFLYRLVDVLVGEMGAAYPELTAGREAVVQMIRSEEERFDAVLTGGLPRLEEVLAQAARSGGMVGGDEAFKLYDTYGLPRDFIEDLTAAQQLRFDAEGFDAAMARQREQARAKSTFDGGRKAEIWRRRTRCALGGGRDIRGLRRAHRSGDADSGAARSLIRARRHADRPAPTVTSCSGGRRSIWKRADRCRTPAR